MVVFRLCMLLRSFLAFRSVASPVSILEQQRRRFAVTCLRAIVANICLGLRDRDCLAL